MSEASPDSAAAADHAGGLQSPVLLAEDDATHVLLIERLLSRGGMVNPLVAVADAETACQFLAAEGPYRERVVPVLVLTDLGLATGTGLEVLACAKAASLPPIPVVVLTASDQEADIQAAHASGADAYLVKPVAFEALLGVISRLTLPWALLPAPPWPAA